MGRGSSGISTGTGTGTGASNAKRNNGSSKGATKALLKEVEELKFSRAENGTMSATLSNGMSAEITYYRSDSGNAVYTVQMIRPDGTYGSIYNAQTVASAEKYAKKAFTDAIKKRFKL